MKVYVKFIIGFIFFVSVIVGYGYSVKGAKNTSTDTNKADHGVKKSEKVSNITFAPKSNILSAISFFDRFLFC